jgi:RNA polymerase sigma-70 factor, ECF subfamily
VPPSKEVLGLDIVEPSAAAERTRGEGATFTVQALTITDEELVARSMDGDVDSFNQLIKRWERPIYALAYRTLGREEDARDVCQETFLRAYRAINGFKGQAKFSSWLYRIALNLCRDWMRKQRRQPVVQMPEDVDITELASEQGPVESIETLVARKELGRAVAIAMAALPEEQRTAIVLKEYHGLTFQEIADMQGCPLSTVKTRLYQGLSVVRRQLEQGGMSVADIRGDAS